MNLKGEQIKENDLLIISPQDYFKQAIISDFDLVKLQKPIFVEGKLVYREPTMKEKQEYCNKEMAKLYPEVKRLSMPHEYYVDGTKEYVDMKNELIAKTKIMVIKDSE